MLRSDFYYDLPESLIAQAPLPERRASRLLCLDRLSDDARDCRFSELPSLLEPGDLLVINDTRVIPARLHGHKQSGGQVEILLERLIDDQSCLAQIRASKPPRPGSIIVLDKGYQLRVEKRHDDMFELAGEQSLARILDDIGHVPLPPYIEREDNEEDQSRYQTVYAAEPGAVAAPTAGLHFDEAMLDELQGTGIHIERITLHVGAGTFQPVRTDVVEEHRLHKEWIEVGQRVIDAVREARAGGHRVIAVGTTSVRALEAAASGGEIAAMRGDTDIFIYPGYEFRVIDALITNFHLPESTLLMLVCALGGHDRVMAAYRHAVETRYRFFSYGDAMFIESRKP